MSSHALRTARFLAIVLAGWLAAAPVLADKPAWAGSGKHKDEDQHQKQGKKAPKAKKHQHSHVVHFNDQHRAAVRSYYGSQHKSGHCPPGLAKKHNGCMPPGQAKKWRIGHPLPHDVVFYEVPHALVLQLGQPPAGYRYVRVAADILMIAVGTSLVVDAIEDLGGL